MTDAASICCRSHPCTSAGAHVVAIYLGHASRTDRYLPRPIPLLPSEDIEELFGEVGALKSASVATRPDGSSKGFALVTFKRKADAETALAKYNGVPLDGRALKITLQSNVTPVGAAGKGKGASAEAVQITAGRGGGRIVTVEGGGRGKGKGGRGRGRGAFEVEEADEADEEEAPTGGKGKGKGKGKGGKGKGKGGKGGKGGRGPPKAEDLDAELDSYHQTAAS